MAGQTYRDRRSAPALAGLVATTWVQRVPAALPGRRRHRPEGAAAVPRFQAFLARVQVGRDDATLSRLAADAGYADQAPRGARSLTA